MKYNETRLSEDSFINYLPESYRDSPESFWARFVSVFQKLYIDIDERIANYPSQMDPASADEDSLGDLAAWLGITSFWGFGTEKLRLLAERAAELYRIWGTRSCIETLFEVVCGQRPYVNEHFKTGGNPFSFTVFLHSDSFTAANKKGLSEMLESVKPAHTIGNMVLLEQRVVLDSHTYLGINSRVRGCDPLRMDDRTIMGIHVLHKEENDEAAV